MDGGESPDTPQHSSKPFYTCLSFHFPFSIRESDSPLAIVLILLQSPTQSFLFSVPTQRFLFSSFATPFTILLFPISNPFSVSLSFHSHSSFQNPSSLHCISLILFQSLLHHSHMHFLTSFHLPVLIAILLAQHAIYPRNLALWECGGYIRI